MPLKCLAYRWLHVLPWLGLAALAPSGPAAAEALPLAGESREAGADAGGWQPFDPSRATRFARNPDGAWLRLRPASGTWPAPPLVLAVRQAGVGPVSLLLPDGRDLEGRPESTAQSPWRGQASLAFPIDEALPDAAPLLLRLHPHGSLGGAIWFELMPRDAWLAAEARRVVLLTAVFAALVVTAAIALVFALLLRDPAFLAYAGYALSYATLQGIQSGFAFRPLGMDFLAADPVLWARLAGGVSVMLVAVFAWRFADLRRFSPRLGRAALAVGVAFLVVALLSIQPWPPLRQLAGHLQNPLVILAGPLLLAASINALRRGSRHAGFFLIAWTPLLVLTVLSSLQHFGLLSAWTGLGDLARAAAGFEAIVLSFGLADRALGARRDRERQRYLADVDALTGVLNRRALLDALEQELALAHERQRPLALLFLDLDRFKQLNDRHGHRAGDAALRGLAGVLGLELRRSDLLGRYGGEEFIIALPGTGPETAAAIGERIRRAVEDAELSPATASGEPARVTVSIGVASLRPREDMAGLIDRADAAMYEAKRAGRNRVEIAATI